MPKGGEMNKNTYQTVKLAAFCTLALMLGPAVMGDAKGAYLDCRMCHLDPAPGSTAKDYFDYFARPERQHPTGIDYPLAAIRDYLPPTALADGILFFDSNGNGIADIDEVQLFGVSGKIECASCHREHGDAPPPPQPNMYLRLASDRLCLVCHRT
jgi:hypothetical protein